MAEPRRTFGPLVLLGGGAGALAAVAGNRAWVTPTDALGDPLGTIAEAGKVPLAAALSLVVLAGWGVLLVTRRRVRRVVAALGLLAAVGLVVTVVVGWVTLDEQVVAALHESAITQGGDDVQRTGWFWAAAVGALGSVAATAAAVRFAPYWPEMGSRYDAPGDAAVAPAPADDDASNLDLWKAMDDGRDPTA